MSYVEIYKINKEKELVHYKDVHNSWLGFMHVWDELERKYLPKFDEQNVLMTRFVAGMIGEKNKDGNHPMQDIWDLWMSDKLTENEKIVLVTTLDNVYIKFEDLHKVANAYRDFKESTPTLIGIADALDEIYDNCKNDELLGAIIWGTSVSSIEESYDVEKLDPTTVFFE